MAVPRGIEPRTHRRQRWVLPLNDGTVDWRLGREFNPASSLSAFAVGWECSNVELPSIELAGTVRIERTTGALTVRGSASELRAKNKIGAEYENRTRDFCLEGRGNYHSDQLRSEK